MTQYRYDVFLSHNAADKPLVRLVADRLKAAGLTVWFDEWVIGFGDDIYLSIEAGINSSQSLALFISANALKSDWVNLERSAALFRDPRNMGRRFIPLLVDNCEMPDTLKRYRFIDFREASNLEHAIGQLIETCRDRSRQKQEKIDDEPLDQYAATHILRCAELFAGRKVIDINAAEQSGAAGDALKKIESWLQFGKSRGLAVLGEPGSGKTYLLRRLCSVLSERRDRVPVFINAGKLRHLRPSSREELLAFADPLVPSPGILDRIDALIVIDGLDELIGPRSADQAEYSETLDAVGRLIPDGARLIISCRSLTFEATMGAVKAAFGGRPSRTADTTDKAIQQALGRTLILDQITLVELTIHQSRDYLSEVLKNNSGGQVASYVFEHLPRVPVILRMLELALPELRSSTGRVDLDELYAIALRAWIFREPVFADQQPERLWGELISHGKPLEPANIERMIHAGLFLRHPRGQYGWSHYSIEEFFSSRSLFAEINRFDTSTLVRLNLISSYNINRFVVPMCRRELATSDASLLRPVSVGRYRRFLRETGWRRSWGYGVHPSYLAEDGTGFMSGEVKLHPELDARPDIEGQEMPVSGISWYDAFAYCKWAGEELPDTRRIKIDSKFSGGMWYWCVDWYEERKAHVAVVIGDRDTVLKAGVNPDVRHSKIALATMSVPHWIR